MFKFLYLGLIIFTGVAFANSSESYNSSSAQQIESIYWLNKNHDSAIVYATWENFNVLVNFIDNILLTGTKQPQSANTTGAELLLLTSANNKPLAIYLTDSSLTFDGYSYAVDPLAITKFKAINQRRINKGDAISPKALKRALKNGGKRVSIEENQS